MTTIRTATRTSGPVKEASIGATHSKCCARLRISRHYCWRSKATRRSTSHKRWPRPSTSLNSHGPQHKELNMEDIKASATATITPESADFPVTTISAVGAREGQGVTIRGWLYNLRESGKLLFPILRDGTGTIQGVLFQKSVAPEMFDSLKNLTQESSLIVRGKVRADKRAPGGYELDISDLQILQRVPDSD